MQRSRETDSMEFGRCTFTATTSPDFRVALYTCASEAEATGEGVISANTSWTEHPNSASITTNASVLLNGATDSCSFSSSSATAGEMRSARVDTSCPSLMKVGPSCSSS
eukprot:1188818-Prorocentrum_minimum.AAC.4